MPGTVEQMSSGLAEPILRRKDDPHVAYWNTRIQQDIGMQVLTMREQRRYNLDIACTSEGAGQWPLN